MPSHQLSRVLLSALAPAMMLLASSCAPSPASSRPSGEAADANPALPEQVVDAGRLVATLRDLSGERAAWSDQPRARRLRQTERLLVSRLSELGYQPVLEPIDFLGSRSHAQASPDGDETPWHNIIVTLPGASSSDQYILVGAHFDSVPTSPGVDDNATGVACLLEAARALRHARMQRSVRLVFFNLEELGLIGSRAHVERLRPTLNSAQERLVGMVSLEMLGYYSDAPGSQHSPFPATAEFTPPTVGNFLALVGLRRHQGFSRAFARAMSQSEPRLPVVPVDFLPIAPPDFARSDHAPFLGAGLPAIMLTDTANFRNPNYHASTDTLETIDQERFTLACRAVIGAIYRIAGPVGEPLPDLTTPPASSPVQQSSPRERDAAPTP